MSDNQGLDWDYILFGTKKDARPEDKEEKNKKKRPYMVVCPHCDCSFPIDGHCPDCGLSYGELFDA